MAQLKCGKCGLTIEAWGRDTFRGYRCDDCGKYICMWCWANENLIEQPCICGSYNYRAISLRDAEECGVSTKR